MSDVVAQFADRDPARYFSILQVGRARVHGTAPTEHWVLARGGHWPNSHWAPLLLLWTRCDSTLAQLDDSNRSCLLRPPQRIRFDRIAGDVAHNTAALAIDGRVLGVGGMYRERRVGMRAAARGILAFEARTEAQLRSWASPGGSARVVVRGNASGCIERRIAFVRSGGCEFDGRLSLAVRSDGTHFLYARANMHPQGGARHVQVTSGPSLATLGPFRALRIGRYRVEQQHNIYFASVKANPADGGQSLVGLFPVAVAPPPATNRQTDAASTDARAPSQDAYLGLAISCDGVHFSPMVRLAASELSHDAARTVDHPADGWSVEGDVVHYYLHRDVPGIWAAGERGPTPTRRSRLVRRTLALSWLRSLTRNATSCEGGLVGCDRTARACT